MYLVALFCVAEVYKTLVYFGPCHRGSESLGLRAHSHEKYTEMTRELVKNHESRGERKQTKNLHVSAQK